MSKHRTQSEIIRHIKECGGSAPMSDFTDVENVRALRLHIRGKLAQEAPNHLTFSEAPKTETYWVV